MDAHERFLALVRREMHAEDARILDGTAVPPDAVNVLSARLGDGRLLLVTFAAQPDGRDALVRRLDMLASTFAQSADEKPSEGRGSRPPSRSLHQELRVLAARGAAVDALVIDANSPMLWGSATERLPRSALEDSIRRIELGPQETERMASIVDLSSAVEGNDKDDPTPAPAAADDPPKPPAESEPAPKSMHRSSRPPPKDDEDDDFFPAASRKAIETVRAMPAIAQLSKGRHLHHLSREDGACFLALSFAGIYVLLLVYDRPFDELRAERAAQEALPTIERLVLALPPLDPEPPIAGAGVIRMRRRR